MVRIKTNDPKRYSRILSFCRRASDRTEVCLPEDDFHFIENLIEENQDGMALWQNSKGHLLFKGHGIYY